LLRASTPFFLLDAKQGVDGRDKPGHDAQRDGCLNGIASALRASQ
jgi:hypothetical protein